MLPLRRIHWDGGKRWQSGRWFLRSDLLFLVPGDSSIGFRLPLEALPWADPGTMDYNSEADPFAPVRGSLPPHGRQAFLRSGPVEPSFGSEAFRPVPQGRNGGNEPDPNSIYGKLPGRADYGRHPYGSGSGVPPGLVLVPGLEVGRGEPDLVRTALTVEPRNGLLHVFLPPLYEAEDWLDLVAAVEATAAEMGRKVFLEGYLPPRDPRLLHFSVTPDPGVIEVNVHPCSTWSEQIERTEELYEEARRSASAPKSSCWTAGTSAPAAATMS